MKFGTHGMVLGLFFALGLVFSFATEAFGTHDGDDMRITADQVIATDKASVEAFLDHIIDYYGKVNADNAADANALTRQLVIYGRALRQEGAYKHSANNVYSLSINEDGILTNHAGHPALFGYQFDSGAMDSAVASTIQTLITNSRVGMTDCQQYGAEDRVACAVKVSSPLGLLTIIAGLHHAAEDSAFELPNCSGFELAPDTTTAANVYSDPSNDANLEAYVKGVIGVVQQQVADATLAETEEFLAGGGNLADLLPGSAAQMAFGQGILQRVYSKAACIGTGDFKHENIYAFIMSADPASATVLFNGNNFDLNGASLELVDDQLSGEQNIARLFNQELGDPVNGASTYVNYHWDDPTNPDDDVPNFFETNSVPGTSCKRSYIEVANINALLPPPAPEILYIFGSGTYPGDEVCASDGDGDSGDDGCAIAGAGNSFQSTLLNLLLVASVLFSVVFLRKRV